MISVADYIPSRQITGS